MQTRWHHTLGLWLLLCSLPSVASDTVKADSQQAAAQGLTTTALTETLLGLVLILALIFVLAWLIKRTGKFNSTANGDIRILSALSVGPRERVMLLDVKGESILVGVTAQQIRTLHVLDKDAASADKKDKYAQFDQQLQTMIQQQNDD